MNTNSPIPGHTIKMAKVEDKERILKDAREKQRVIITGIPIRLSADFSAETLQARRMYCDIFKVPKGKNLKPRILYPVILLFRNKRGDRELLRQTKLKEFFNTKPTLKEILKAYCYGEKK